MWIGDMFKQFHAGDEIKHVVFSISYLLCSGLFIFECNSGFPCVQLTSRYTGDGHGYVGKFFPRVSNVSYTDLDLRGCATPVTLTCNASFPCERLSFDGVRTSEPFVCENVDCTAVNVSGGAAASCCRQCRHL